MLLFLVNVMLHKTSNHSLCHSLFPFIFCTLSILLLCIQCTYVAMVTDVMIYDSFSLSELPIPSDWFNLKCSTLL